MSTQTKLSTLWVVVLFNMIYADIFSIIIALVDKNTLQIPTDVKLMMAIAAVVTNIPILMILLSRILPFKWNKLLNIISAFISVVYIIAGGSVEPHYFIIASFETGLLITIIVLAWRWKRNEPAIVSTVMVH